MLKNRKTGKLASSSAAMKSNNKRYLILTYVVEFDRVHYPLPLRFEDAPAPEVIILLIMLTGPTHHTNTYQPYQVFRRTIARLRDELDLARSAITPSGGASAASQSEMARLRQENQRLVQVVAAQEREEGGVGGDGRASERESELEGVVAELEQRLNAQGSGDGDAERIEELEGECEALATQVEEEQVHLPHDLHLSQRASFTRLFLLITCNSLTAGI
jgi:coiled-coil domain-containing protein 61